MDKLSSDLSNYTEIELLALVKVGGRSGALSLDLLGEFGRCFLASSKFTTKHLRAT